MNEEHLYNLLQKNYETLSDEEKSLLHRQEISKEDFSHMQEVEFSLKDILQNDSTNISMNSLESRIFQASKRSSYPIWKYAALLAILISGLLLFHNRTVPNQRKHLYHVKNQPPVHDTIVQKEIETKVDTIFLPSKVSIQVQKRSSPYEAIQYANTEVSQRKRKEDLFIKPLNLERLELEENRSGKTLFEDSLVEQIGYRIM